MANLEHIPSENSSSSAGSFQVVDGIEVPKTKAKPETEAVEATATVSEATKNVIEPQPESLEDQSYIRGHNNDISDMKQDSERSGNPADAEDEAKDPAPPSTTPTQNQDIKADTAASKTHADSNDESMCGVECSKDLSLCCRHCDTPTAEEEGKGKEVVEDSEPHVAPLGEYAEKLGCPVDCLEPPLFCPNCKDIAKQFKLLAENNDESSDIRGVRRPCPPLITRVGLPPPKSVFDNWHSAHTEDHPRYCVPCEKGSVKGKAQKVDDASSTVTEENDEPSSPELPKSCCQNCEFHLGENHTTYCDIYKRGRPGGGLYKHAIYMPKELKKKLLCNHIYRSSPLVSVSSENDRGVESPSADECKKDEDSSTATEEDSELSTYEQPTFCCLDCDFNRGDENHTICCDRYEDGIPGDGWYKYIESMPKDMKKIILCSYRYRNSLTGSAASSEDGRSECDCVACEVLKLVGKNPSEHQLCHSHKTIDDEIPERPTCCEICGIFWDYPSELKERYADKEYDCEGCRILELLGKDPKEHELCRHKYSDEDSEDDDRPKCCEVCTGLWDFAGKLEAQFRGGFLDSDSDSDSGSGSHILVNDGRNIPNPYTPSYPSYAAYTPYGPYTFPYAVPPSGLYGYPTVPVQVNVGNPMPFYAPDSTGPQQQRNLYPSQVYPQQRHMTSDPAPSVNDEEWSMYSSIRDSRIPPLMPISPILSNESLPLSYRTNSEGSSSSLENAADHSSIRRIFSKEAIKALKCSLHCAVSGHNHREKDLDPYFSRYYVLYDALLAPSMLTPASIKFLCEKYGLELINGIKHLISLTAHDVNRSLHQDPNISKRLAFAWACVDLMAYAADRRKTWEQSETTREAKDHMQNKYGVDRQYLAENIINIIEAIYTGEDATSLLDSWRSKSYEAIDILQVPFEARTRYEARKYAGEGSSKEDVESVQYEHFNNIVVEDLKARTRDGAYNLYDPDYFVRCYNRFYKALLSPEKLSLEEVKRIINQECVFGRAGEEVLEHFITLTAPAVFSYLENAEKSAAIAFMEGCGNLYKYALFREICHLKHTDTANAIMESKYNRKDLTLAENIIRVLEDIYPGTSVTTLLNYWRERKQAKAFPPNYDACDTRDNIPILDSPIILDSDAGEGPSKPRGRRGYTAARYRRDGTSSPAGSNNTWLPRSRQTSLSRGRSYSPYYSRNTSVRRRSHSPFQYCGPSLPTDSICSFTRSRNYSPRLRPRSPRARLSSPAPRQSNQPRTHRGKSYSQVLFSHNTNHGKGLHTYNPACAGCKAIDEIAELEKQYEPQAVADILSERVAKNSQECAFIALQGRSVQKIAEDLINARQRVDALDRKRDKESGYPSLEESIRENEEYKQARDEHDRIRAQYNEALSLQGTNKRKRCELIEVSWILNGYLDDYYSGEGTGCQLVNHDTCGHATQVDLGGKPETFNKNLSGPRPTDSLRTPEQIWLDNIKRQDREERSRHPEWRADPKYTRTLEEIKKIVWDRLEEVDGLHIPFPTEFDKRLEARWVSPRPSTTPTSRPRSSSSAPLRRRFASDATPSSPAGDASRRMGGIINPPLSPTTSRPPPRTQPRPLRFASDANPISPVGRESRDILRSTKVSLPHFQTSGGSGSGVR